MKYLIAANFCLTGWQESMDMITPVVVGPIKEIIDVLHIAKKCGMLDTLEKFYILRDARRGNPINDKFIVQSSFRGVNSEYHIQGALTPNNIGFHTGHRWKQSP